MNKSELIAAVADRVDMPKAKVGEVLEAIMETITRSLEKGDGVGLVGFGNFTVKDREARQGRNPKTLEPVTIPASRVAKFSPGAKLKEAVNTR